MLPLRNEMRGERHREEVCMRLEFLGAARSVTGSSYLLHIGEKKVLVDCGMYQGGAALEKRNRLPFTFDPRTLAAVIVTHAHIDHIGLLPKLVREGYGGPIHATHATCELARLLLADSAHIAQADAEHHNRKAQRAGEAPVAPLYGLDDAEAAMRLFAAHPYEEEIAIVPGLRAVYRDAGHILGSAFVETVVEDGGKPKRLTFSGDIGHRNPAIIRDPEPPRPTDALLIESTYGDRLHKSHADTVSELAQILKDAYADGGNVVIPAFAVGRTQEILYRLRQMAEQSALPPFRIYVDSPLAISVTQVVRENPDCWDEETLHILNVEHHDPLAVPRLAFTRTAPESIAINNSREPAIIISANGMCSAGRILHHLKHNLWRRESRIVFVGFQGEGTLGRMIVDGAPRVKIMGETIAVAAHIATIGGLSAHADRDGLTDWLAPIAGGKPRTFVVHGEAKAADAFAQTVREKFGIDATVPSLHDCAEL
jgi:metallo-beta-lactamase family protein